MTRRRTPTARKVEVPLVIPFKNLIPLCLFLAFAVIAVFPTFAQERKKPETTASGIRPDDPRFFPLKDVKPGMKGVGRTIFQGDKMEEFGVDILGVLPGTPNADQSLIVIRLNGANVERTFVFAGMSGSPVFVDGKLLGAVAFSFPFGKEPLGMITPISQMAVVFEEGAKPAQSSGYTFRDLAENAPAAFFGIRGLKPVKIDANAAKAVPALTSCIGQTFQPITTPLTISGVPNDVFSSFANDFEAAGFKLVAGPGSPAPIAPLAKVDENTLAPGKTVTVDLMRGDMGISAAGTVTWRDGDEILAFGHPFFSPGGIGGVGFPMTEGTVITVVPNLNNSFKMTIPNAPVGVMTQDRSSAIQGRLGKAAEMIPVTVNVTTAMGKAKSYHFEIVNDTFLTPILVNIGVTSSLSATERSIGDLTLRSEATISLEGQPPLNLANSFTSNFNPGVSLGVAVSQPLAVLLNSGFPNTKIRDVTVNVTATDARQNGTLERLWANKLEVRRGETIELRAFARNAYGQTFVERIPLKIPEDARLGKATVLVGDGGSVNSVDRRAGFSVPNPQNVGQLVKAINQLRKNDRLYLKLYRSENGAVVNNEDLPSLPPSYLSTISSNRVSTGYFPISVATILERELEPARFTIAGQQSLVIEIIQ